MSDALPLRSSKHVYKSFSHSKFHIRFPSSLLSNMFGFAKIILIALAALTAVEASAVPEAAGAQVEKRQSR